MHLSRKLFLSVACVALAAGVSAQMRKIPATVTEAFRNRYPHAVNVAWKDKISFFEADFQLNNSDMIAKFSSDGNWQSTEREMDLSALPQTVKDGFSKSKYADWTVQTVTEVQENTQPLQYKITVKKSGLQKKNLVFSAAGKLIKECIVL